MMNFHNSILLLLFKQYFKNEYCYMCRADSETTLANKLACWPDIMGDNGTVFFFMMHGVSIGKLSLEFIP